ncbi:MAG TPA: zinc-ribbon domain-containing protein [Nitrososphaerales archaeon]|nr:zinc-ribbon domain-containing protein [Nitrososphaerales archaeon]
MSSPEGIKEELGWWDVISKSFDVYRQDYVKYLVLYVVVGAILGVATTLVSSTIPRPAIPANPTIAQTLSSAGYSLTIALVTLVLALILYPISVGSSIKMASDRIGATPTDLGAAFRHSLSRIVSFWIVSIVVGIIVSLGFIALVVPGIILLIMFSLVIPVVIIENKGALDSLGRSRELVGHRWAKTFVIFLVVGIGIAIASLVVDFITSFFAPAQTVVGDILEAFYIPYLPVLLTVYYYSNVARTQPPPPSQPSAWLGPNIPAPATVASTVKYCPSCGNPLTTTAAYCPNCGAKQP